MVSIDACSKRKHVRLGLKAAALTLSCGLAISSCLPSQAYAAPLGSLMSSMTAATETLASVSEAIAAEAAAAEAASAVDPTTRTLEYDANLVAEVGTQVTTGHTSCCLAFSQAMGDTIMTGEVVDHTEYAFYGNCAASPCASFGSWTGRSGDLSTVYDEINEGRPVVVFVSGNGSYHHYVLAVGYCGVEDPDAMTLDNVVIVDPWDGETMVASERFVRSNSGELRFSE